MKLIKDYVNLCKVTGGFYRDHWKGIVAMNAALIGAGFIWLEEDKIKDFLKEKFKKEEAE